MFFAAFVGEPTGSSAWADAMQRHAAWLGLSAHLYSRLLADGRTFAFGWASIRAPDTAALVRDGAQRCTIVPLDVPTREHALTEEPPKGFGTHATRMDVSLTSGEVWVTVPVLSLEKFYYARTGDGWVLSNDLRLIVRIVGLDIDVRAVYTLFQYGSVPSPLTLSRNVLRVVPGHTLILPADSGEARLQRFFSIGDLVEERRERDPEEYVLVAMDTAIARTQPPVVVHFSGGVDSALVAARLAALRRTDARLQRFTLGPSDPFHEMAPAMARHLGLEFEEVYWNPAEIVPILQSLAQEYAAPLADPASLPTLMLIQAMAQWASLPTAVLTGTGAQSLFASGRKARLFRRLYAVPRALRRLVAAAYPAGLWRGTSRLSWFVGAVNKTAHLPAEYAAAGGHSSMDGFAFRIPPHVRAEMERAALAELDALAGDADLSDRISISGGLRNSMCQCGARVFDPLRRRGVGTVMPFLEPETVRAAFSLSWDEKCLGGEPKGLLKELLARQVPREWAYWPKGRFLLPYYETFRHSAARDYVRDVVFARDNPILSFCNARNVEAIFRRVEAGQPMHVGVRPFVWTVTFLSAWLHGLRAG